MDRCNKTLFAMTTTMMPMTMIFRPIATSPPPTHHMITRTRTNSLRPKEFTDFQLYHTSTPNLESEIEPVSYKKAAADPRWRHAMQEEYDALISNVNKYHIAMHAHGRIWWIN